MITFRKGRRESELSLMARGDDRRGSAISLTSLRRQSIDGAELFLSVPSLTRDRRDSSATDNPNQNRQLRSGSTILPAITKRIPDPDSVSNHSDEVTIDLGKTPSTLSPNNNNNEKGFDRRVSTQSMVIGAEREDFKANNQDLSRRIWMNIIVMSVAFMLLFSSISTLAGLQSSIHEGVLGVVGLAVTFGTVVVSCVILPKILIKYIGYKWTVTFSMLGAVVWMITNIFAAWESVIPGSVVLGLSWAPLWTAHSAYVTSLAKKYAMVTAVTTEDAITKFFGVFYTLFLTSPVWGNLVSAGILGGFGGGPEPANATGPDHDETIRELLKFCGANYCPQVEVPLNATAVQVVRPTFEQIATLVGINVGITFVGFLAIAIFVDKEESPRLQLPAAAQQAMGKEEDKPLKEILLSTMKQTIRKKQLLLMPFTIYTGLEQAFLLAEFTGAFVACAIGINYVSLATICYGLVGGAFAVVTGKVALKTGRAPIFATATIIHLGTLIFLIFWDIDPGHLALFFIVPALWGMGDSVFQSQINSLYGNLFCDNSEAAFATYRMFESVGFILGYGYSGLMCVSVKIYILIVLLIISNIGYFIVEIWVRRKMVAEQAGKALKTNGALTSGSENTTPEVKKPVKKLSASKAPNLETTFEAGPESEA